MAKGVGLTSRRVLRIGGAESVALLQRILTNDVRSLARPGAAPVYAAIQNAQGRLEHDVFLHRAVGGGDGGEGVGTGTGTTLLADLPAEGFEAAVSLLRRLRLRSAVTLDDVGDEFKVAAAVPWYNADINPDADSRGLSNFAFLPPDPRWTGLGLRGVVPAALLAADGGGGGCGSSAEEQAPGVATVEAVGGEGAYHAWRYANGVAEGTSEMGGLLPLECNLAGLNGVSFEKGCYIGQELTARTHFTGVVRKRLLPALFCRKPDGTATVRPGMDVYLASCGLQPVGRAIGKVVAARPHEMSEGLVMLRLQSLAPDDGQAVEGMLKEVRLMAWDKVRDPDGRHRYVVKVATRVPDWWLPGWIDDACR